MRNGPEPWERLAGKGEGADQPLRLYCSKTEVSSEDSLVGSNVGFSDAVMRPYLLKMWSDVVRSSVL